jgi:hypothetical protein
MIQDETFMKTLRNTAVELTKSAIPIDCDKLAANIKHSALLRVTSSCEFQLEAFVCRGVREGEKALCRCGTRTLGLTTGKKYRILFRHGCNIQVETDTGEERTMSVCPFFTGPDILEEGK